MHLCWGIRLFVLVDFLHYASGGVQLLHDRWTKVGKSVCQRSACLGLGNNTVAGRTPPGQRSILLLLHVLCYNIKIGSPVPACVVRLSLLPFAGQKKWISAFGLSISSLHDSDGGRSPIAAVGVPAVSFASISLHDWGEGHTIANYSPFPPLS